MESEAQAASFARGLRLNTVLTHLDVGHTFIGTLVETVLAVFYQIVLLLT